ncbi:MAG: hypothetical protein V3W41_14650 [Planctomycetota bacterium]
MSTKQIALALKAMLEYPDAADPADTLQLAALLAKHYLAMDAPEEISVAVPLDRFTQCALAWERYQIIRTRQAGLSAERVDELMDEAVEKARSGPILYQLDS